MIFKSSFPVVWLTLLYFPMTAQEKGISFSTGGYVTSLQSAIFDSPEDDFINDNLLHNRLNFNASIGEHFCVTAEIRNRLFTGDMVKTGKSYTSIVSTDPGWMDLSWNLLEERAFFLNTSFDRLSLDFRSGKTEIHAGRQRINWGQAMVWNPNDIFNVYSFFDVDYPERPGCDAIRLQLFPSFSSVAEAVVSLNREKELTLAGLWRFNRGGYDVQFLGGYAASRDMVAGTGWSGNIGTCSFRGEATLFMPVDKKTGDETLALVTAGLDKALKDNSMVMVQLMYCTNPPPLHEFSSLYAGTLSARNLAFSEFTAFGQFTWAASPLANVTLSAMWFPDLKGYYAGPSLDFSLAENVDFSAIWQHFTGTFGSSSTNLNMGFLRVKYNF
jgi:hypothetical protein